MRSREKERWWVIALAIALLLLSSSARAAITPESDVLLPWFEIDLERHDVGLATSFSIVNASLQRVPTRFTVYTNWGIPVLEVPIEIDRTAVASVDLHKWIADGILPDRQLSPAELANLQAMLTGKPSPVDGLYYSSPFQDRLAVGYVIAQTLGERPDVLWGDMYSVDLLANHFEAETLTALTHGLKSDCTHHGVRFVNQDRLLEGDELIIWSGRRFEPSPTPNPIGKKVDITVAIYDQAGNHVHDCYRALIAVEPLLVCHLEGLPPIGWLDIVTEEPTFILQHLHSTTQASAELHSYCLRAEQQLAGPAISIEKKILENEADVPDGPHIEPGNPIEFQYYVRNSGTVPLTAVRVSDDTGIEVTCPKATLAVDEMMVCKATSISKPCLNVNVGTATGVAPSGARVTASDPAYYLGVYSPAITVELLVNDDPADSAPGVQVDEGTTLQWTYLVTNTGNVKLSSVYAANKNGERANCPKDQLEPGESMTCTATGLATQGQHHEIATAKGADPCRITVTATDPAYYFGRSNRPAISIEKYIGESDADTPPGPTINVNTTVHWRYVVTNTGNVPLSGITVTDDGGVTPVCPKTALDPGESMLCTASSPARACQYHNIGTVTGHAGEQGPTVTASDPAYYFGQGHPAVTLEMSINGDPADVPPGPWFDENAPLVFTFEVTNTGDVPLTNLVVSDDHDRSATCPATTLQPGGVMSCTINGLALAGTHEVFGSVYGRGPCGDAVEAHDPAYYRGRVPTAGIDLVKMTNGVRATAPPGPSVALGSAIQWTYVVTNTGTVALTNLTVTDSGEVTVSCPKTVLDAGEAMTCTASGVAQACQYSNTATARGEPPSGPAVTDSDVGFYFGQHRAAITIDKKTNGDDAAQPPGPSLTTGTTVQWTFLVTNTGDVGLTSVAVIDDRAGTVSCPKTALLPGESMTCTASGTVVAGPQRNVATATGTPPCGNNVTASDASHYLGVTPGIALEKLVNGKDADTPVLAVQVNVGETVLFSFVVTNTGDVTLSDIAVTDNRLSSITCPKTSLAPGEAMTCTASSIATPGADCNLGRATGTSPQGVVVESTDSACYNGLTNPSITLEKSTNGVDADTPPGPQLLVGSAVNWTYVVTNAGNVQLSNVSVTDNRGVTVTCPKTVLAAGESMTCTASGTATVGQYANIGTATGTPLDGNPVSATDPSHYLGINGPSISIEKKTNGQEADTPTGPMIAVGMAVNWTYVVTNTGDVPLTSVGVVDNRGVTVTCPKTTLAASESMTCTASGTATAGQYSNTGTATGTPPSGPNVTASDPSHYFGSAPSITLEKRTNGQHVLEPTGPELVAGTTVSWTYIVTNNGNVALTNVSVIDSRGVTVTCPKTTLAVSESMTCTASGTAITGQYSNMGTATGEPPVGNAVVATDMSYYFGVTLGNQGCTPGYWKNHTDSWPPTGYSPTQTVVSVFPNGALYGLGSSSLLGALGFAGGSGNSGAAEILLRAAVAALLNASHPNVDYPRTALSVLTDTNNALATQDRDSMLALAAALDADNNRGCPLN